ISNQAIDASRRAAVGSTATLLPVGPTPSTSVLPREGADLVSKSIAQADRSLRRPEVGLQGSTIRKLGRHLRVANFALRKQRPGIVELIFESAQHLPSTSRQLVFPSFPARICFELYL